MADILSDIQEIPDSITASSHIFRDFKMEFGEHLRDVYKTKVTDSHIHSTVEIQGDFNISRLENTDHNVQTINNKDDSKVTKLSIVTDIEDIDYMGDTDE